MNKRVLIVLSLLVLVAAGIFIYFHDKRENDDIRVTDRKILVVYYSATGNTKRIAEDIVYNLNADVFEIIPSKEYTSEDLNYNDSNSRVSLEHNNESLRNVELISTDVPRFDEYDIVLLGYPIWWGIAAWPIDSFVKANDFTGKTVIPFCTSASSGVGNSDKLLKDLTGTGVWKSGYRFNSSASKEDIKKFTDSIK